MARSHKKKDPIPTSIGDPAPNDTQAPLIRESVLKMSGFGSEEEMENSLSEDTNKAEPGEAATPRRRRRKSKSSAPAIDPDDPMNDPLYAKHVSNMAGYGGKGAVTAAFKATGAPLDSSEEERVEGVFYVASKKYGLDPTRSGLLFGVYCFFLLAQLIVVRVLDTTSENMWKQFQDMFAKKDEPQSLAEPQPQGTTGPLDDALAEDEG